MGRIGKEAMLEEEMGEDIQISKSITVLLNQTWVLAPNAAKLIYCTGL